MSSGRPTLGDLIRSIDYSNIKSYDGRPDHPVTKLKALKHECVDDGISFNELKVGLLIYLQWIDFFLFWADNHSVFLHGWRQFTSQTGQSLMQNRQKMFILTWLKKGYNLALDARLEIELNEREISTFFYVPNFEKVGEAYCFLLVRSSVRPSVRHTFNFQPCILNHASLNFIYFFSFFSGNFL